MQKVYLLCSVPGAGKSYVCEKLKDKYNYVPHDNFMFGGHSHAVERAAKIGDKPVLTDIPFGERPFREELLRMGLDVTPIFIIEPAEVVKKRYETRPPKAFTGRVFSKANYTRCSTIKNRANEWNAAYGTSDEVLQHLRSIK